jgi:hypothetical protein
MKMKPMRKPGVPWQVLDGIAVIVAPAQQQAHELDEVGTFLWNLFDGEHSIADICTELCETYDVNESVAMKDIESFIGKLQREGLIEDYGEQRAS